MSITAKARRVKTDLPAVFFAIKRPTTPWPAKILALAVIVYALSPIDLIPDFIPILGLLDEIILLPLLLALAIKLIPADVLAECRAEASTKWSEGRAKKWYYALPIVLCWLIVILILVRVII